MLALYSLSLLAVIATASPLRRASFTLQNGLDAQALNAQFASLTTSSPCTAPQDACINGQFAQCVGGSFVVTGCAAGEVCGAAPLVNSAGTSIICDTEADLLTRIANTGATGGLTGSGSTAAPSTSPAASSPAAVANAAAPSAAPASSPAPAISGAKPFTLQNGLDAQALNAQFATLTTSSPCTAPQDACVNGGFAQCVNGAFVVTPCAGGEVCGAAPLVNSAGTSVICDTEADLLSRIANTGATGGLTGSGSTVAPSAAPAASSPAAVANAATPAAPATSASPAPAPATTPGSTISVAGLQVPAACAAPATRKRAPLVPRIAQNLPAIVAPWTTACEASGGDITTNDPCNDLSTGAGITALLAAGAPCDQQNVADQMIDFALSPGVTNSAQLISIAQAYRQNPRNALNVNGIVPSTFYCQEAPKNSQLNGLFNGQLQGVDPGVFGGSGLAEVAFGANGTCPFGQTPDVNTCSCT